MENIDVSVIVATRNAAEYLPTCLAHLENQSFPAARYEIIVIDDGSTDETPGLLDRYAAAAPVRMHCIHQKKAGSIKARNRGIREAHGRWLLFLDDDLLASPNLIERHVRLQERHASKACVVGQVTTHPQLAPGALTKLFTPEKRPPPPSDQPLHFLDWRRENISIPKKLLLSAGGFDETFHFPEFDDSELAHRLTLQGVQAHFAKNALAYIWRPATFSSLRGLYYAKGYSLFALVEKTRSADIFSKYPLMGSPVQRTWNRLVVPFYIRACKRHTADTPLFNRLYKRILRHDISAGYHDARKGRRPRPRH